MKPSIEADEKVVLECPVTFRLKYPLDMTPIRRTAYLTNNRLIIERGEEFIYIPFEWMMGLNMTKVSHEGHVIEIGHEKKVRFSVLSKGSSAVHNRKTEKLFMWLHRLCIRHPASPDILKEIYSSRKEFG